MQLNLVTFTKGGRKDFKVSPPRAIIGRRPESDIRIPLSDVSRQHCEIVIDGAKVRVKDLGSRNGTYVNEKKVEEALLKAGDHMQVGPVHFTVQIDGMPKAISPPKAQASASKSAGADTATRAMPVPAAPAKAGAGSDFDIDSLEELDAEDLSDFDLDEQSGEIEEVEEISEADLFPDEEDDSKK